MDYSQVLEAPSGGFAQARAATRGHMRGALALFMATLCMLAALVGTAVAPQEAYAATCTVNFNIPANTVESNLSNIQKQGFGTLESVTACIAYQSGKDTPLKITAKSTGGSVTDWGGYTTQKTLTVGSDGSITGSMSANESVIYLILCLTDTNGVVATTGYGADKKSTDGVTYERTGNQKSTSTSTIDLTSIDTSGLWLMTPTVTVTTDGEGSVSATGYLAEKSTGTYTVKVGNTLTLTATANAGYVFKNWTNSSGSSVSTSETYTPTVTTNASYTANFGQAEASLTTSMGTTYGELQDIAMAAGPQYVGVITILKSGLERQNLPSSNVGLPQGMQVKSGVTTDKGVTITINKQGTDIAWDDSDNDGNTLPHGFHFWAESNATDQSVTVSSDGTSSTRTMYAYTEGTNNTMVKVTSTESDFTLNSNASGTAGATVTGITAGKSVSIGKYGGTNTVTVTAKTADDTFTFDKDGNITLNSADSSATVPAGTAATVGIDGGKAVTVPSANTGDAIVKKTDNGGSEVTLAKSADKVTVNNTAYTAASAGTVLAFDKDGNATLSSGALNLAANTGAETANGNTITNAGTSTVILGTNLTGYDGKDAVFVASGGSFTVKNGDKTQTYTAAGDVTDAALYLVDNAGNVTLVDGTSNLADGQELTGASGQKIGNPADSGDDTITVEASDTNSADLVTVPAGGKVVIGGTEYDNAGTDDMLLEVTSDADGNPVVTLEGGSLALDPGDGFGVNGAGITAPDTNASPIVVTANEDGSKSVTVQPGDTLTYTDENGDEHTIEVPADGSEMTFTIDADGNLVTPSLKDGESVIIDGVIYEGASDGESNKVTLGRDGTVTIDPDGDVNSADEQTVNDFIEKYAMGEDGKVFTGATTDNYEQILSGADAWNALSDGEKAIINDQLVANGGATFDELLAQAEALESATDSFIDKYLTDSYGNIYTQATRDNYAQILSGLDAWNALSQDEKDAINAILVANGGKTYEELLAQAQDIQKQIEAEKAAKAAKAAKTGDMIAAAAPFALAAVALAAGALAFAASRRPRGKHVQR